MTAGSIGVASPHHIGMEWFKNVAGIDMAVIPFRGIAPSLQAVLSGEIDMMLTGVSVADQYVKTGALKQIAVASPQRLSSNPELPTFAEQGYPDFNLVSWYGLVGPAKMPEHLASFWRDAFKHATGVPTVRERINASGADVVITSSGDFSNLIRAETTKFKSIFQATGIKPEP